MWKENPQPCTDLLINCKLVISIQQRALPPSVNAFLGRSAGFSSRCQLGKNRWFSQTNVSLLTQLRGLTFPYPPFLVLSFIPLPIQPSLLFPPTSTDPKCVTPPSGSATWLVIRQASSTHQRRKHFFFLLFKWIFCRFSELAYCVSGWAPETQRQAGLYESRSWGCRSWKKDQDLSLLAAVSCYLGSSCIMKP